MSDRVSALGTTVPVPPVPFLDANGYPNRAWLYFFMALFNRTGGAAGTSPADISQSVANLAVQEAFDAAPDEPGTSALSISDVFGGDEASPSSDAVALLAAAFADAVCAVPVNPFLASLFVADAT